MERFQHLPVSSYPLPTLSRRHLPVRHKDRLHLDLSNRLQHRGSRKKGRRLTVFLKGSMDALTTLVGAKIHFSYSASLYFTCLCSVSLLNDTFFDISKSRNEKALKIQGFSLFDLERVKGIEPSLSAWEAGVMPLYDTRFCGGLCTRRRLGNEACIVKQGDVFAAGGVFGWVIRRWRCLLRVSVDVAHCRFVESRAWRVGFVARRLCVPCRGSDRRWLRW